jgi:hypothetical protein
MKPLRLCAALLLAPAPLSAQEGSPDQPGAEDADRVEVEDGAPGRAPQGSPSATVDRVVVTVDDVPITASEVALESELRARTSDPQVFGRLLSEPVEPLEACIFRQVLRVWPGSRDVRIGDESTALQRLRAFELSFGAPDEADAFRERWGLTRSELLEFFAEHVLLDAVIDVSVQVRITDDKELAYYEQHRDAVFAGRPLDEVADDVSARVYALEFEAAYNAWRSTLRSRAVKRYLSR